MKNGVSNAAKLCWVFSGTNEKVVDWFAFLKSFQDANVKGNIEYAYEEENVPKFFSQPTKVELEANGEVPVI